MENVALLTRASAQNVDLLTRSAVATAPTIVSTTLADGAVGVAYSQALTITGSATITTSVVSGALPGWASLNTGTHTITGTPSAPAVSSFTIRATNSNGTDDQAFTLTVPNGYSGTVEIAGAAAGTAVSVQVPTATITVQANAASFLSRAVSIWSAVSTSSGDWTPV